MPAMTQEEFNKIRQEFKRVDVKEPMKCDACDKTLRMQHDFMYYYKLHFYCDDCKFKLEMGQCVTKK